MERTAAIPTRQRDRHADLARAVAIWAVVVGHWLVIAITEANGAIDGVNALGAIGWSHPLTWLFQVMPLFFFVGGYANAISMDRHRRAGGDPTGWVVRRYLRLLVPSTALLAVLAAGVVAATALGVDPDLAGTAAWLATVPLWFLAVYVAVVALAPIAHRLHRRWGLAIPVACAAFVGLVDMVRMSGDDPWIGNLNYAVAWFAIHQLGFSWHDGRLPGAPRAAVAIAAAGGAALVALTVAGPYPVSMVRVPGEELQNTEPPTLALLALAVTQVGVLLALRPRLRRWLQGDRPWRAVSAVQSVVLTLFLWHMAAALLAALALYGTGAIPVAELGSAEWLLLRLPWLAGCGVALAGFVALFGRLERAARAGAAGGRVAGGLPALAAVGGVVATFAGMFRVALAGSGAHGPAGLPTEALLAYAAGFMLLLAADRSCRADDIR